MEQGCAPTFRQVAAEECLLLPPTLEEGSLPCVISPLSATVGSLGTLKDVLKSSQRVTGGPSRYILTYRSLQVGLGFSI